jgi:hypothetical protein
MPVDTVSGVVMTKLFSGLGGLVGGLAMFAFMRPKSILDATIRGGICTAMAIIFSPLLLEQLKLAQSSEHIIAAGTFVGFVAWGIMSSIARVFIKAEKNNKDIIDIAKGK